MTLTFIAKFLCGWVFGVQIAKLPNWRVVVALICFVSALALNKEV